MIHLFNKERNKRVVNKILGSSRVISLIICQPGFSNSSRILTLI